MHGFALDSASVMIGKRNSVLSHIKQQQPSVFSVGCICHLAALCAAAGLKTLPVPVVHLLVDIYCHFKHSSKRCEEYSPIVEEFTQSADIGPLHVLKHCTKR